MHSLTAIAAEAEATLRPWKRERPCNASGFNDLSATVASIETDETTMDLGDIAAHAASNVGQVLPDLCSLATDAARVFQPRIPHRAWVGRAASAAKRAASKAKPLVLFALNMCVCETGRRQLRNSSKHVCVCFVFTLTVSLRV